MIISDYIGTAFDRHDKKWLVQAMGNATVQSVCEGINKKLITVDRHYIFIVLGHNQLQSAQKGTVNAMFTQLLQHI